MSAGQPLTWLTRSSLTWLAREGVIVGPWGLRACRELETPCRGGRDPVGGLATDAATEKTYFIKTNNKNN